MDKKPGTPQKNVWRLLNRDGSFNIARLGLPDVRWSDLYHSLLSLTWPRFMSLLSLGYLMTNALFALGYMACGAGALDGTGDGSFLHRFKDAFFFSVQTFATIGYGRITPVGIPANILVTCEALVGLFGFALATGLLFARFSRPTAKVIFSNVAVVNQHEGVESLIFRLANARLNQIVEAQISVVLIKSEVTQEGETYRTFHDLKLETSRTPIFALTWTVVHPITKESPLYGMNKESLLDADAELLVSLTGIDDTFSQSIHARYSYIPTELLWNKTFVDILSRPYGMLSVDIKRLHDVEDA